MQYDIIKNNETEYIISDTISVVGEFGISLNIEDKVNKQPFSYGLYNLELYIDGEIKYKVEYNTHDFSDGPLVLKERNYNLKRTSHERFYNLYNDTPSLSFIDKRSWPSYKLEPGIHNMIIKANDINDNKIIIFGTISANDNKDIILNFTETKEDITASIGPYGPYLKHGKKFISLKEDDVAEVGINRAIELIQKNLDEKKEIIVGLHPETKQNIIQKKGIKGRPDYLSYNKKNYSISDDFDKNAITLEKALEIIEKNKKTKKN